MKNQMKFIITRDVETIKKLVDAGFVMVSQEGGLVKFLNQPPTNFSFSNIDKAKYCLTNVLSI